MKKASLFGSQGVHPIYSLNKNNSFCACTVELSVHTLDEEMAESTPCITGSASSSATTYGLVQFIACVLVVVLLCIRESIGGH